MSRRFQDIDSGADRDESLYGRWSRRKRSGDADERNPETVDSRDSTRVEEIDPTSGETADGEDKKALTDSDMPDIDTLTGESSYADFLSEGVSEELKKKALRKLFHAATYNVCDGLDDYAEDYTRFEKLGDIVTADMRHRAEMEEARRQAAEREPDEAPPIAEHDPDHDAPPPSDTGEPGKEDIAAADDSLLQAASTVEHAEKEDGDEPAGRNT